MANFWNVGRIHYMRALNKKRSRKQRMRFAAMIARKRAEECARALGEKKT